MKIGTQASDGIEDAAVLGSMDRTAAGIAGAGLAVEHPEIRAKCAARAKPMTTRVRVAKVFDCSSPLAQQRRGGS